MAAVASGVEQGLLHGALPCTFLHRVLCHRARTERSLRESRTRTTNQFVPRTAPRDLVESTQSETPSSAFQSARGLCHLLYRRAASSKACFMARFLAPASSLVFCSTSSRSACSCFCLICRCMCDITCVLYIHHMPWLNTRTQNTCISHT